MRDRDDDLEPGLCPLQMAVQIGHRNNRMAEVIFGLTNADRVVLHPSDRVSDGRAVTER